MRNLGGTLERVRDNAKGRIVEVKADRAEAKADRMETENQILKAENRTLRDELQENRSERQRVLDLLDKATMSVREPKKRRFRLFRLLLAAGAIYAAGSSTGTFDRAREWIDKMRGRAQGVMAEGLQGSTEPRRQTPGEPISPV